MKTLKVYISLFALTLAFSVAAFGQTVLNSVDGARVDVTAQSGKVVVLVVGASWLPLSDKQAEVANTLSRKYASRGVVFYFVATDSTNSKSKNFASDAAVKQFAASNKIGMTILRDSDGTTVMHDLKVEQIPSFVILNKQGKVATEPFGGIDPKFDLSVPISKAIDKLL